MLHRSPREFGYDTSLWTLEMAAQASFEEGLTHRRVSGEAIRGALARLLGVRRRRAPRGGPTPAPPHRRKKGGAVGWWAGAGPIPKTGRGGSWGGAGGAGG